MRGGTVLTPTAAILVARDSGPDSKLVFPSVCSPCNWRELCDYQGTPGTLGGEQCLRYQRQPPAEPVVQGEAAPNTAIVGATYGDSQGNEQPVETLSL
jgi:hypothetical protein